MVSMHAIGLIAHFSKARAYQKYGRYIYNIYLFTCEKSFFSEKNQILYVFYLELLIIFDGKINILKWVGVKFQF